MAVSRRELLTSLVGLSAGAALLPLESTLESAVVQAATPHNGGAAHNGGTANSQGSRTQRNEKETASNPWHRATYEPFVQSRFKLRSAEGTVSVRLAEVEGHIDAPAPGSREADRDHFSLVFTGPASRPLAENIYRLSHPRLGRVDLFLTPGRRHKKQIQYHALINRIYA